MKKSSPKPAARPAPKALAPIIANASKGPAAAHEGPALSKAEQALLATALERSESTRNAIETSLVEYGRWLLVRKPSAKAG